MEQNPNTLLAPVDEYLKAGTHIGTKYKTEFMKNFIYKTRPDGLSVLNIQKIDERLKIFIKFLSRYEPDEVIFVGRRPSVRKALRMFEKATGIKVFNKRYPPGALTNPQLDNYFEVKLIVVMDPMVDRNIMEDSLKVGIPVVAFCDTNNINNSADLCLPANNKGRKSVGFLLWLIAKYYLLEKGLIKSEKEFPYKVEDFQN